jgi:EAL domain-containing protein (putative c-di-GMP-specific phosphodiesterase class I)/CBS domain-containing protein
MTSGEPLHPPRPDLHCVGSAEASVDEVTEEFLTASAWLDQLASGVGLSVVFQPIVNLLTGDLVGHEVLGRFATNAPEAQRYGAKDPPTLLDLAHAHGRLLSLDRAFRKLGIEAAAQQPPGAAGLFFLNVDPRVIENPSFASGYTRRLIEELGLHPARFVLELTEAGAALDNDQIERFVDHYASQGFRIALDDVGAGYASLTALVRLRPHFLKLDKELVSGLADDVLRTSLVRSLADFGRRSGLLVIAEGIETERDLAALIRCGVPLGQGYLLGRPAREPLPPLNPVRKPFRASEPAPPCAPRAARVAPLVESTDPVLPSLSCHEAARLLRTAGGRRGLPVVTVDGIIAGLITRDALDAHEDEAGASALAITIDAVMDRRPLSVDEEASLEYVCRVAAARDKSQRADPVLVHREGRYAGLVPVHVLLTALIELELELTRETAHRMRT